MWWRDALKHSTTALRKKQTTNALLYHRYCTRGVFDDLRRFDMLLQGVQSRVIVFAPSYLIIRVFHHLNKAEATYIVIVPHWTQCVWLLALGERS
ncbi:hypothetical protein EVAR_81446_1 [Eumeta japonica]|uniref:Uncharacterized protein n=1 Tax=Eumeta variegata TaxID=151549 RepID=A0A4C1W239_EUMVA|nr:hypothetical protein EVAR_81446_1 [Eumeta japonica]